ncbi:hypothetical protein ACFOZ7_08470 [Natribaculum luteum]|uniref:Secreted protein n=1 Tax=Natribaculum luteum TaxID=1586232 RepID=A0ABD5NYD9_9EURY|nr:hypothetical protein [Natribaculum luteum]
MKRHTVLTLVVVGSLLLVGFAGTAAAGADGDTSDGDHAVATVDQDQDVKQGNIVVQNADQDAEQESTGLEVDVDISEDDNNNGQTSAAGTSSLLDPNDGDGFNLEIGTTGDQTVNQNVTQNADASNRNSQTGTATAVNLG